MAVAIKKSLCFFFIYCIINLIKNSLRGYHMKLKKLFLPLALLACGSLIAGFAACDDGENGSSTSENSSTEDTANGYTVTFTQTEGVSIVSQTQSGETIDKGATVSFTLQISSFYEGEPIVTVNNSPIQANEEGEYSFTVNANSVLKVDGVQRAVGDLTGAGTSDDAYVINSVQDLLYMAEKINEGDTAYTGACYFLANDIDCEGTQLNVIGDGNTSTSYFSGVFNGNDKTISNYTMQTTDSAYVGFFGWVVADSASSATSAIYNLTLENFSIDASAQEKSMFCGSLIGYSIGATISQCNAYNGTMQINGDDEFSNYAGGLIGLAQATYLQGTQNSYNACVAYCISDVDLIVNTGVVVAGGGLVGYAFSDHQDAVAYIVNCYATGDVSGAIRAGGLLGILGQYTSVSSCYATGDVQAKSTLKDEKYGDLRVAYAGGLVGYGENNSVVADCFAVGKLTEKDFTEQGNGERASDKLVGSIDKAGYTSVQAQACVVFNGYYAVNGESNEYGNFASADFQNNHLKFPAYDWVISDGSYPAINYSYSEDVAFMLTLDFGETPVNDQTKYVLELSSHFPLTYLHLSEDVPEYLSVNDTVNSYGYFFDQALTIRVPRCFVTTRNITLYTGFADNKEVSATYYLQTQTANATVRLTLYENGTYEYYDGGMISTSTYVYDGKSVLLQNARFARYLPIETDISLSELFNRFAFFDFKADVQADGSLAIYGGARNVNEGSGSALYEYFYSADQPLLAVKTAPTENEKQLFVGEWHSEQAIGYTLIFDNEGNYAYNGNMGTYTVEGNQATLSNGKTVSYADGVLKMNGMAFYAKNSFVGAWVSLDSQITLRFNGIDEKGVGKGEIVYGKETTYKICYIAETNGALDGYITVYSENQLIGFLMLDNYALVGYFFDPVMQAIAPMAFRLCDAFNGEWISDSLFEIVSFNGLGNYDVNWGDVTEKGSVTINGENVPYEAIDNFYGRFTYDGVKYSVKLDVETNTVTVTYIGGEAVLQRKDAYAALTLTDENGNVYTFDGRGALGDLSGTMKITSASGNISTLQYTVQEDGSLTVFDGAQSGVLSLNESNYLYTIKGVQKTLKMKNFFSNNWAIAQMYAALSVDSFDLKGNTTAKYPKVNATGEITYLTVNGKLIDKDTLALYIPEGNGFVTLYLFAISNDEIAISTAPSISYGDYTVAAIQDELFGVWTSKLSNTLSLVFEFDGLVDSSNTTATAIQTQSNTASSSQAYYYSRRADGNIMLWSANTIGTQTAYNLVEWCSPTERGAFVNADGTKAFKLVSIDAIYQLSAYTKDGAEWLFDGKGGIQVFNESEIVANYTYTINAIKNSTVELTVMMNGETVKAIIDYSGETVLVEIIETENA